MTGPQFHSQDEVDRLLSLPKFVKWDAWSNRLNGRPKKGEKVKRIEACPQDENDLTAFWIEARHRSDRRVKTSFTLHAKIIGRPGLALCRYDVQDQKHTNWPKWWEPRWIELLVAHRHVYNVRAVREGYLWDACAAPLHLGDVGTVQNRIERAARMFLSELKIEIHDPDAGRMLFDV